MVPFGGGFFFHRRNQKFRVFSTSKIFKNVKKINEKIIIFGRFFREFGDFLKIFKILSKFSRKFREKFRKYGSVWGPGAEPPEASENIKKVVEKSMENGKILKLFMKF